MQKTGTEGSKQSSRVVDKGGTSGKPQPTTTTSGGPQALEPLLGGAAREPTNFFAVRGNVFAHFLLRARGGERVKEVYQFSFLSI